MTPTSVGVGASGARASVLVLWVGYPAGPNVLRSLSRAGFRVFASHPEGRRGGRSWSSLRPLRYPSPTIAPDAFLERIDGIRRSHGIDALLPIDEDIVRLLAERGHELGPVQIVGPTRGQYRALCGKATLPLTAAAAGVDSPATCLVDAHGLVEGEWPSPPSIVKPATSTSAGLKVRLASNAAERDAVVAEILSAGGRALVQEHIRGPRWVVHSARGAGVFECLVHRVRREWPRSAGLATVKTVEPAPEAVVRDARRLLEHVDYRGPGGVSFIEREGRYYVHDVNLRLGATVAASLRAGFDFPRRGVEAALELGGLPFSGMARRGTYLRLDMELIGLREALTSGSPEDRPGALLREIVAVGMSPRGRLDPSPLDPLGVWPAVARSAVGPVARRLLRHPRTEGEVHP